MSGVRLVQARVAIKLRLSTRIWYLCMHMLCSDEEMVDFGSESMGSPD